VYEADGGFVVGDDKIDARLLGTDVEEARRRSRL
jgi:hypothetical protein